MMDAIHKPASNQAEVTVLLEALTTKCNLKTGSIGLSVMGRRLHFAKIGQGERCVLISAGHHANEWIGTQVLMRFLQELCEGKVLGVCSEEILNSATLFFVPLVNPDGVELAQGHLKSGYAYDKAREIAAEFPQLPFPEGWKANIHGVDLNLQYPAGWEIARQIKAEKGYFKPAPRDFVGFGPLEEPESRALAEFTRQLMPDTVIALHSQGEVIYWKYGDCEPQGSGELGKLMSMASGYTLEETPFESGHAGYKDWFIEEFNRPGYTIELGLGENPLPDSQLDSIYSAAAPMLLKAALF